MTGSSSIRTRTCSIVSILPYILNKEGIVKIGSGLKLSMAAVLQSNFSSDEISHELKFCKGKILNQKVVKDK